MERLLYPFVWLSRIFHCQGFGVQSPADYRFVRYVINEHWPYYQYDELRPTDGWLPRRLGRLYFRLANWRQPRTALIVGDEDCQRETYIQAGCQRTRIMTAESAAVAEDGEASHDAIVWSDIGIVLVAPTVANWQLLFERALEAAGDQTVLVLEDIHRDKAVRTVWERVVSSAAEATITFDLYYCGIILVCKKRSKQHYIVNF